jgi:cardiolipin synthase
MLETIAATQRTLCLLSYIYWSGDIAREVADAVAERARAGVVVCVLLDAVGSVRMPSDVVVVMSAAGARVERFRPVALRGLRRADNRNHRKLLISDGRVGMTGGVGIAEEWTGNAEDPDHWRDSHVRVRGPVVRGLHGAFAESWLETTGELLCGQGHLPELEPVDGGGPMQLVRSRAGVGDTNAEALMYLAIASARETLDLTSAYFAPRAEFTGALCEAAARGVTVRILVPGEHADKDLVRRAGQDTYEDLLECGIEVHEYGPTMLHAKTLVIDGTWATIGSVNFDNRSFCRNDEATLCVQSPDVAGRLTAQFERDLECSDRIDPGTWKRRNPARRVAEAATRIVRREL